MIHTTDLIHVSDVHNSKSFTDVTYLSTEWLQHSSQGFSRSERQTLDWNSNWNDKIRTEKQNCWKGKCHSVQRIW